MVYDMLLLGLLMSRIKLKNFEPSPQAPNKIKQSALDPSFWKL